MAVEKFSTLLKQFRKERKLTQAEFANKIGKSQQIVAKYEKDINFPPSEDIAIISDVIGVSCSKIIQSIIFSKTGELETLCMQSIKLDDEQSFIDFMSFFQVVIDDQELTTDELKEAVQYIRFLRYKNSKNID